MTSGFDVVIVTIVALAVLLLVAGAEGMWRRLADVHELMPPRLWHGRVEQYHAFRIG
jgi:hypothetical protein